MYSLFDNDDSADFARTAGARDKQKRKRGLGFYAAAGGGVAGLGAAARYGGAELSRMGSGKRAKAAYGAESGSSATPIRPGDTRGGAKGRLMRDYNSVTGAVSGAGKSVASGAKKAGGYVSSNWKNPKKVGSDALDMVKSGAAKAQAFGGDAYKNAANTINKIPGGTAGKVGAGLLAAGALAGAGYGANKYAQSKKRKKSMLDRLLSRR
jgi:hypothetical protein